MSFADSLRQVVEALDAAGVPFMVAGSVASGIHGETRSTQHVDLVVDPDVDRALDRFVELLDEHRFYVSDHRAAFRRRDMFNVIDIAAGWKFDLIVRHDRPFSVEEFARGQPTRVEGIELAVASPEDVVLSKLERARLSGSARQVEDARAVVRANRSTIDVIYLEVWAEQLDVVDLLRDVLEPPAPES